MRLKMKWMALCGALLVAGSTFAGNPSQSRGSAEFERMKTLVGVWKGMADMGEGPVELTMQYRLLAGGTVLEERSFAGTPHEMVTMYYEKGGRLALTHYCVLGNRPGMLLGSSDDKSLKFEFDKECGIDAQKEDHMHSLKLTFVDEETVVSECKAVMGGKLTETKPTTLKRVKS